MERTFGRPKTLSRSDESNYDYQKRAQRQKYKENTEYNAKCKLKYYKKLYRDNEDFNKILEVHNNILEILPKVLKFHHLNKINKITKSLENL